MENICSPRGTANLFERAVKEITEHRAVLHTLEGPSQFGRIATDTDQTVVVAILGSIAKNNPIMIEAGGQKYARKARQPCRQSAFPCLGRKTAFPMLRNKEFGCRLSHTGFIHAMVAKFVCHGVFDTFATHRASAVGDQRSANFLSVTIRCGSKPIGINAPPGAARVNTAQ
jgi:hypothetical protein